MDSDKEHIETLERVANPIVVEPQTRMQWERTIIALIAINASVFAGIIALVGSGMLAMQTTEYLGDNSKSAWLSTIVTIFTLSLNPMLSQAADYWGRKWIVIITSLCGLGGALCISRSGDIQTLIAGFCVLGISFGCQSSQYAVASEILPRQHRSYGQASVNVTAGIGAIAAILMGGALLNNDNANFRIYWYIVAGLYFIGVVGVAIGYRPPLREQESTLTNQQKFASMDWAGALMLSIGLVTFCTALQYSENPYGWTNAHVVAPFVVGVVLLVTFAVYEWRYKDDGIMNHKLFGDRNFVVVVVAVFIEGLVYFTTNSYYVFEVQTLTQMDLFQAGLRYSILFFTASASALFNSIQLGPSGFTSTSATVLWGYPVIGGIGLGCLLTNLTVAAQMSTPKGMISVATGVVIATRSFGASVGLAVNNALFKRAIASNLAPKIAAAVLPLGFPKSELGSLIAILSSGDAAAIAQVPNTTPMILSAAETASIEAYALAFRNVWICAATFCAAGLVCACFLKNVKHEFTKDVDAPAAEERSVFAE
ncbi:hypothetical protein AAEP93_003362 [Penicillium crustosum]